MDSNQARGDSRGAKSDMGPEEEIRGSAGPGMAIEAPVCMQTGRRGAEKAASLQRIARVVPSHTTPRDGVLNGLLIADNNSAVPARPLQNFHRNTLRDSQSRIRLILAMVGRVTTLNPICDG